MSAGDRLYAGLPSVIRVRDAEVGEPLRALLNIVGEQADALTADIARGYENLFIETCADWVVPYLAALVGAVPLYDVSQSQDDATALAEFEDLRGPRLLARAGAGARADIARTLATRRRKGTVSALADVAQYASGFPVRLAEGLARTGWTQHQRHSRPDLGTARLPTRVDSALVGGPFDRTTRFLDVRRPDGPVGWYHPAHEMLAVYRQRAIGHRRVTARQGGAQPWRYRLDPLGLDRPLFTRGCRPEDVPPGLQAASVPDRLRPALFEADLLAHRQAPRGPDGARAPHTLLYGQVDEQADAPAASLGLWMDGSFVTPAVNEAADGTSFTAQIVSRRLDPWPATRPHGRVVAVDVRNGRVAVGDGLALPTALTTSFFHGTAGQSGGGDYQRSAWLVDTGPDQVLTVGGTGRGPQPDHPTVTAALAAWAAGPARHTVLRVLDSRTYALPAAIDLAGRTLAIEAADLERPVLRPDAPTAGLTLSGAGALTLTGLALDGRITVEDGVEQLRLLHCTLPPGGARDGDGAMVADGPSVLVAQPSPRLRLQIAFCLLGAVRLDAAADEVLVLDSVVSSGTGTDAVAGAGAPATGLRAERSTFLGDVSARTTEASECVFTGRVLAARTQQGCLRYCYLPPDDPSHPARDSRTPRRFACQPERAVAERTAAYPEATDPAASAAAVRQRVRPVFVSRRYGDPGFGQLDQSCPAEITRGAADGAEIGAFNHVKQAQRLENIRHRLDEYLPAGITGGTTVTT
ncbi:hypothetical protein AB0O75_05510 [Streptomyces sp. NPDC088921]|uniref:hypothetical protein n=1 Tax=unclassified Streptomyces TaxID=2593676 RepID=UPI00344250CF